MKSKKEEATTRTRTVRSKYTASFKVQALERAEKDGMDTLNQQKTIMMW